MQIDTTHYPDVLINQADAIKKTHQNGHHIGALKMEYKLFQQPTLKGKYVGFYIVWRHYRELARFSYGWFAKRWLAKYGPIAEQLFIEPDYNHPYYRRQDARLAAEDYLKWVA